MRVRVPPSASQGTEYREPSDWLRETRSYGRRSVIGSTWETYRSGGMEDAPALEAGERNARVGSTPTFGTNLMYNGAGRSRLCGQPRLSPW